MIFQLLTSLLVSIFYSKVGNTQKMLESCLAETRYIQTYDQFDDVIMLSFKKIKRNN